MQAILVFSETIQQHLCVNVQYRLLIRWGNMMSLSVFFCAFAQLIDQSFKKSEKFIVKYPLWTNFI